MNLNKYVVYVAEVPRTGLNEYGSVSVAPQTGALRIALSDSGRMWGVDPTNEGKTLWTIESHQRKLAAYRVIAEPSRWTPEMLAAFNLALPDLDKAWSNLRAIAER